MPHSELRRHFISPQASVREAAALLESCARKIVLVVDTEHRLLGTVTDGDIRRAIVRGVSTDAPVVEVMRQDPLVAGLNDSGPAIVSEAKRRLLKHVPVIDDSGRVIGLDSIEDKLGEDNSRQGCVFIFAGGQGSRLRPLTENCPKPMLKIGAKPILETIIEQFVSYGFREFYISVNYRAEMIIDYFGNGAQWGVTIEYIREDQPLGTAGSLGLLTAPADPIIVINGDILSQVNFSHLRDFHLEHEAMLTMAVRNYEVQIPYGIVETQGLEVLRMVEKPVYSKFVNAGIYCISAGALTHLQPNSRMDMPELIERVISSGSRVQIFPLHEYWMDIGRLEDFNRAQEEYSARFRLSLF